MEFLMIFHGKISFIIVNYWLNIQAG